MNLASVVHRNPALLASEIQGEVVALDIDKGNCYGMNKVGSEVWRLIAEPVRVADVCSRLQREYRVEPETCERDVLDLLEELRAEGMLVVEAEPAATPA